MESSKEIVYLTFAIGTAGMLTLTVGIVLFIYLYQRKLIKRKLEYQKIADLLNQQELKTTYAILDGQETERKRVAKELHDNLGSLLVTANLFLDTIPKNELTAKVEDKINKLDGLLQTAASETRRISHNLDSGLLKHFGLAASLNDLAETIKNVTALQTEFDVQVSAELDTEISLELYRIVQELINNTLKHAQAGAIRLEILEVKDQYLSLIYEDDGRGFDTENASKGIGLKNIDSRIYKLNGSYSIDAAQGKGVAVNIEIPLHGKED